MDISQGVQILSQQSRAGVARPPLPPCHPPISKVPKVHRHHACDVLESSGGHLHYYAMIDWSVCGHLQACFRAAHAQRESLESAEAR